MCVVCHRSKWSWRRTRHWGWVSERVAWTTTDGSSQPIRSVNHTHLFSFSLSLPPPPLPLSLSPLAHPPFLLPLTSYSLISLVSSTCTCVHTRSERFCSPILPTYYTHAYFCSHSPIHAYSDPCHGMRTFLDTVARPAICSVTHLYCIYMYNVHVHV